MAEIFLGAVVGVLVEKLVSSDFINLARSAGILSEMTKWKNNLDQIQALLADAGQKQIRDRSVEVWLGNLQHLAYDIDNVLDGLAYEALRRQLNNEADQASSSSGSGSGSNKVWKIIPTCFTTFTPRKLVYGHNMSYKLDEITTRLLELVDQKFFLGLTNHVERSIGTSRRVEQTSLINESEFVGRVEDKESLLRLLKEPCDENVNVVAIVGMGGMGKTTLANVLYKEVMGQFDLDAWVCVSNDFNMLNISKAIYIGLGGEDKRLSDLNQVHKALAEKVLKKKFLVVLDDVWNEDHEKWRVFQLPFGGGALGSKILVTTRKDEVASVMDCIQPYHLKSFSNKEALSLFALHAKPNFNSDRRLKKLGEGIIEKCDGLPLALRTLGRMLRRKTSVKVWEDLLNSEIWSLQDGNEILPALRLSYYDLPSHLKRVFAYCSLFPKDYMFNKDELVLLWMAEGFLNTKKGKKSMESLGRDYFDELKSRSFFEQSTDDKSQYTMHDLINELATSVAGEFFFRANDELRSDSLEKFHHFSFIWKEFRLYHKFKQLHKARRLRTFLALPISGDYPSFFKGNVIVNLLPSLQFLRVLSLTNCLEFERVPQSIGYLKHIRYLNFSYTAITCLPEEVSDLYNLQSLLLRGCDRLFSLPHSFEKLLNLRHLDIDSTSILNKLPLGIGGLTSLQTLSKIIIEEDDGFKISELEGLSNLHGQLSIKGLSKVRSVKHAQKAKLDQKDGLDDLEMEWGDVVHDPKNEETAYGVLGGLRPHSKLRKLTILSYNGTRFPSWVGDPSFEHLTELRLYNCKSTCLPTLGRLPLLTRLFVRDMTKMTTLDANLLGPASSCLAFPALKVLEFCRLPEWRIWSTNVVGNNGTTSSFCQLREISILDCPILDDLSIGSMPSLEVLRIRHCPELVLRNMVGASSSICRLEIEAIEGLTHLHGEVIEHLGTLEYLRILSCPELTYLWETELEACKFLVNLLELEVKFCENLLSVEGKDVNLGVCMNSLRKVDIRDCKKLESYACPNGVERLVIRNCSSMTSLTFEIPDTLQFLSITNCNILEESCFHNNFPSLESLLIDGWSNLRSFREGCLAHLTKLSIENCDDIESVPENGFGFLPHLCLRYLHIDNCKNLKSFPHQHLQRLTYLQEMGVTNCLSMNDSFPCGSWPPNLSSLSIGDLKKPMTEWGSQNFPTSLSRLNLLGKTSGVVSFAKEEDMMNSNNTTSLCFFIPPSLTSLEIRDFLKLRSISEGLQHLTRLESLEIRSCPYLEDLPKILLSSLSSLSVFGSKELEKRCRDQKGDYWPIIAEISSFNI